MKRTVAVIGGGPAGLRAAEVAAEAGHAVTVFEAKPSPGRKFLVAGSGGLNLTHSEPLEAFAARYGTSDSLSDNLRWKTLLAAFPPEEARRWAAGLGIETFVGTSGRVFPLEKKAAPLLRRWIERLRRGGVRFRVGHRWTGLERGERFLLRFEHRGEKAPFEADTVVLALGGASWPETGSDGGWVPLLEREGIEVRPWAAANCGWGVDWPEGFAERVGGEPLKNIALEAGGRRIEGECVLTRYGIEGSAIYPLGPVLRAMPRPSLRIDLKPSLSAADLLRRWGTPSRDPAGWAAAASERWRLGPGAASLLAAGGPFGSPAALAERAKAVELALTGPRPIAEAISSAGGVAWGELDEGLMLRKVPGLFAAGEMIDWEAPTGGYLLQGCLATGTVAGQGVARRLAPESA